MSKYQFLKKFGSKIFAVGLYPGRMPSNIFNLSVSWTKNCNHAGFSFELSILGKGFYMEFVDCRHWDKERGVFEDIGV